MVPWKRLAGPALIAAAVALTGFAVAGALLYNGHQDRLQRHCAAMLGKIHNDRIRYPDSYQRDLRAFTVAYKLEGGSPYCITGEAP